MGSLASAPLYYHAGRKMSSIIFENSKKFLARAFVWVFSAAFASFTAFFAHILPGFCSRGACYFPRYSL